MDQQAELLIAEWKEKVTSIFNINYILTQQFYDLWVEWWLAKILL